MFLTALDGGRDTININGEFKIQSNTKINLASIPQKEENTIFIGERTAKGLWFVQGYVHNPCPRWRWNFHVPNLT